MALLTSCMAHELLRLLLILFPSGHCAPLQSATSGTHLHFRTLLARAVCALFTPPQQTFTITRTRQPPSTETGAQSSLLSSTSGYAASPGTGCPGVRWRSSPGAHRLLLKARGAGEIGSLAAQDLRGSLEPPMVANTYK